MKNSTFNYVLRRVLVFLVISIIIMLFNACEVHAESYPIENYNTRLRFMPNDTYINNANWNQNYWNGTPYDNYKGFDVKANLVNALDVLFEGRYLISFLVWSNQYDPSELYCGHLSSNFKNVNMYTGQWVQNELHSSCLDVYHVTYLGKPAWRILYEFTYESTNGADSITEMEFIVNSERNFFNGDSNGLDAGITVSDIMDYDLNIINTWNTDKSQQTIINGQQDIINNQTNNTNSIIYNQNNNTQDIINSQEELNQDLIDNQNENTQDIIDNQNQNTQDMIDSQMVCTKYDLSSATNKSKYLDGNGNISASNSSNVTDYIPITNNDKLYILNQASVNANRLCFYNVNKTIISCLSTSPNNMEIGQITIPTNASYVIFTINKDQNKPQYEICKNGNQALVDSLTDDSSPSLDALNNSAGWLPAGPVDSILNLPISLFNNISDNLSKNCQPVTLPIPYVNQNLVLPCVNTLYEQMGITTWINLVGTIASALILYSYLTKLYKWVDDTLTFRENNSLDNWGGI